jgi:hypothetical protein
VERLVEEVTTCLVCFTASIMWSSDLRKMEGLLIRRLRYTISSLVTRLWRVGLRLNRRIIRIRRIFVEFGQIELILYRFNVRSNYYIKYLLNIWRFVEFFLRDLSINAF